jgi:2-haloacid dehalogenase
MPPFHAGGSIEPDAPGIDRQVKKPIHMSVQAIIFDFGNVLVDWDPRYLYRKIFNGDDEEVERFLEEVGFFEWNLKSDAGRPFHLGIKELCEHFPHRCEDIWAYENRFEESISGPIWQTVSILKELKQAGYRLYGLSNWSMETFNPVRDTYEFFGWFDDIVLSGEVGLLKPDPAIFRLTLERIGLPASECLLIDDSAPNIWAAQELGFQTIRFESADRLRGELKQIGILQGS